MKTIKISDIIIPSGFDSSKPKKEKLDKVKKYVVEYGKLDKPIILKDNVLVDNYIRYLVAKEVGMEEVPYITTQEYKEKNPQKNLPVTYIVGKFKRCSKEYTWKLTKDIPIAVGDRVLVKSKAKFGNKNRGVVTVVSIFTSNKPELLKHKSVIKKLNAIKEN